MFWLNILFPLYLFSAVTLIEY